MLARTAAALRRGRYALRVRGHRQGWFAGGVPEGAGGDGRRVRLARGGRRSAGAGGFQGQRGAVAGPPAVPAPAGRRLAGAVGLPPPRRPDRPRAGRGRPDLRAAWHEAFAALGPSDGPDVRGMSDGLLLHLRDTYPIESAWAPQWVGDELRQVRAAAWDAHLTGLRAGAEAAAAKPRNHPSAT